MADVYYPPVAFYFQVAVMGPGAPKTDIDGSFQEVSGIEKSLDVEEVVEGGENRFTHRLPKRAKYPNLVLKRGVVTRTSSLATWAGETIGSNLTNTITTKTVQVTLLNPAGSPMIVWKFVNAYPIKWVVSSLQSTDNNILTETLELSYNYFERKVL